MDNSKQLNLHEKLQLTPLFQGLTADNLLQIVGQTKFRFQRVLPGTVIRREGEPCQRLAIVMGGTVSVTACADDHGYSISETTGAPFLMQPECLFGLTQHYTRTFCSTTTCDIVEIDKDDLMRIADDFVIFRINLTNLVCALAQKAARPLWHPAPEDHAQRIAAFVRARCAWPTGAKTLRAKMTRLAVETGLTRREVSAALNDMQRRGLLSFSRGIIKIPQIEALK